MMAPAKRILCISWNPALAREREEIFSAAGCNVRGVVGRDAADLAIADCQQYDVLILGHSVPRDEKRRLMRAFRSRCDAPILSLLAPGQNPLPEATLGVPGDNIPRLRQVAQHLLC